MKIYSIEGNIGSGKTMLWDRLNEESRKRGSPVDFFPESAMSIFQSIPCLMENYYEEPAKYCGELNARIIEHGCENLRHISQRFDKVVLDSSLLAARNVFLPSAIERNLLSEDVGKGMIKTIDDFFDEYSIEINPIWLSTKPKICLSQIQQRARSGEEKITLGLLQRHHDLYRRWLVRGGCMIIPDSLNFGMLAQFLF